MKRIRVTGRLQIAKQRNNKNKNERKEKKQNQQICGIEDTNEAN